MCWDDVIFCDHCCKQNGACGFRNDHTNPGRRCIDGRGALVPKVFQKIHVTGLDVWRQNRPILAKDRLFVVVNLILDLLNSNRYTESGKIVSGRDHKEFLQNRVQKVLLSDEQYVVVDDNNIQIVKVNQKGII